jgi:hypothetical protein
MTTLPIEAIGAALSQKNVSQVKQAWSTLTALLVESGNLSIGDIPKDLLDPQKLYDAQKKEINASDSLVERVAIESWHQRFKTVLHHFQFMLSEALFCEEPEEKEMEAAKLLSDFVAIAKDLIATAPSTKNGHGAMPMIMQDLYLSSEPEEPEQPSELKVEATETLLPAPDDEETFTLEIQAKATFNSAATNERVVEGILFKIDQPSEAIPNVGPGLPLYIPRAVALEALACLDFTRPKPLDAHDSLSRHASTEIVGAMTAARIDGDDFCVSGVLWDYNQPQKVEAIASSQDALGMSVNATAEGHPGIVDGQRCWLVDRLRILGANILFSAAATFKKTRTSILAEGEENEILLAASELTPGNSDMDFLTLSRQLSELAQSSTALHMEIKQRLMSLEPEVLELKSQMAKIEAASRQTENQELQAASAQAKAQERQELIDSLTSVIDERLGTARRTPGYPSRTLPLAASATPSSPVNSLELQLAGIEGELRVLEASPNAESARIYELKDLRKSLQSQLAR